MTDDPRPQLEFQRSQCPKCRARTEKQAETRCRPVQDQTGEYECPGEFGSDGYARRPTDKSIRALNLWCVRQMARDEAHTPPEEGAGR